MSLPYCVGVMDTSYQFTHSCDFLSPNLKTITLQKSSFQCFFQSHPQGPIWPIYTLVKRPTAIGTFDSCNVLKFRCNVYHATITQFYFLNIK